MDQQCRSHAVMTLRPVLLIALFAVLLLPPRTAFAGEVGPTWESETAGLPVSTMQGEWTESVDRRSVDLSFVGGHLIQPGTTFKATWRTPFTTERESATFDGQYEFENQNSLGSHIPITQTFRFRYRGEPWQGGIEFGFRLKPGMNYGGGGLGFMSFQREQVQFEWTWTGKVKAPTYLRGSANLTIN